MRIAESSRGLSLPLSSTRILKAEKTGSNRTRADRESRQGEKTLAPNSLEAGDKSSWPETRRQANTTDSELSGAQVRDTVEITSSVALPETGTNEGGNSDPGQIQTDVVKDAIVTQSANQLPSIDGSGQNQSTGGASADIAIVASGDLGYSFVGSDTFAESIDDHSAQIDDVKQTRDGLSTSSQPISATLTTSIEGGETRESGGNGRQVSHSVNSRNSAQQSISAFFSNFSSLFRSQELPTDPINRLFQIALAQRLFESGIEFNDESYTTLDLLA